MNQEHEVVLYQIEGTNICVNVMFKEETFWMTQKAMANLFDCTTAFWNLTFTHHFYFLA